ncbi:hypothetical protein PI124_g20007 [Phytophthora idaei]|nr:hypothetical protein PI124_g20007 [Phytophthora idaei]
MREMSESTHRMLLFYLLLLTPRMKRELLHPPHPSSDRTTSVLIRRLPPQVLLRLIPHVRLRSEHVVCSREARDHAHHPHDDCSLLHRRTSPIVRMTTRVMTLTLMTTTASTGLEILLKKVKCKKTDEV